MRLPHRLMSRYGPGLGWVLLAVCMLQLHSLIPYWIFGDGLQRYFPIQGFAFLFRLLAALSVWACVVWLSPLLARRYPASLAPRMLLGLLAMVGVVLLAAALVYLLLFKLVMGRPVYPGGLFQMAFRGSMVASCIYGWLLMRDHAQSQADRASRLQRETETMALDADRSELAMLEAQIEPHFLFNTLAHIKRLYRIHDIQADQVLTRLIDYLDIALPALRKPDWCIDDELGLVELYLSLIEQRFGGRLRFAIHACAASGPTRLPALTIATLVENAVRHGLGPKAGEGAIVVAVARDAHDVVIKVSDDGVGLRTTSGKGLGLATVRARLLARFGRAAALLVEPGAESGVVASIRLAGRGAHA